MPRLDDFDRAIHLPTAGGDALVELVPLQGPVGEPGPPGPAGPPGITPSEVNAIDERLDALETAGPYATAAELAAEQDARESFEALGPFATDAVVTELLARLDRQWVDLTKYDMPVEDGRRNIDGALVQFKAEYALQSVIAFLPAGEYVTHEVGALDFTGGPWSFRCAGAEKVGIYAPDNAATELDVRKFSVVSGFTMVGPLFGHWNNAATAVHRNGVVARGKVVVSDVHLYNLGAGLKIVDDHQVIRDVWAKQCKDNVVWTHAVYSAVAPDFTHGDQTFNGFCDFVGAARSSIRIEGSAKWEAVRTEGAKIHTGGAPWCITFAPKAGQEVAMVNCTVAVSFEYIGLGYVLDEGYGTGNRRMISNVKWNMPMCGFITENNADPEADPVAQIKVGLIRKMTIDGFVGDDFNHTFALPLGIEFENCDGLEWRNADLAIARHRDAGVRMFRMTGAASGFSGIRLFESHGAEWLVCKVQPGQTVQIEKGVAVKWADNLGSSANEVRHWDSTAGAAIGVAGFTATALPEADPGYEHVLVPVIRSKTIVGGAYIKDLVETMGPGYAPVPGEEMVPDRANPGFVRFRGTSRELAVGRWVGAGFAAEGGGVFRTKLEV